MSWTGNSGNELAFEVWRKSATDGYQLIKSLAPNTTLCIDPNLTLGATYTYRVRAVGALGASAWTNEVSWSVPAAH
jgi:titin